ncbi:MAG: hypothetical protein JEZ04_03735 [Spirochaetales bacterium]|nr:hypothetical protein [Spirochaetales bacterium]
MALVKIITGETNSGKTTMALRLEAEYRKRGQRTAGFIAEAEYEDDRKSSYYLRNIEDGSRMISVTENPGSVLPGKSGFCRYDFSRFYFYTPSFTYAAERIDEIIGRASGLAPDVVFIDEIGPLELSGQGHSAAVERLLSEFGGSLILVIREDLLDKFLETLNIQTEDIEIIRTARES